MPEVPPAPHWHHGLGWNVVTPVMSSRLVGDLRSLSSLVFLTRSSVMWDILPCFCHLLEPLPTGSLPAQATSSPSVLASSGEEAAGREEEEVHAEETLPCLPGSHVPCSGHAALAQELGLAQGWQQLEGPVELLVSPDSP